MKQLVTEQPIHRLDVVLDVSAAATVSSKLRERRLPPEQQRLYHPDERRGSRRVPNY